MSSQNRVKRHYTYIKVAASVVTRGCACIWYLHTLTLYDPHRHCEKIRAKNVQTKFIKKEQELKFELASTNSDDGYKLAYIHII